MNPIRLVMAVSFWLIVVPSLAYDSLDQQLTRVTRPDNQARVGWTEPAWPA